MAEDEALGADAEPAAARPLKRRQPSMLGAALQIALIGAGVFLGLAGDEWRENARDRRQAAASLQGFRAEIVNNRRAVQAVVDYHATVLTGLRAYLNADRTVRNTTQAMYLLPLREEFDAFAGAAETFFADMVVMEPALIALYDETLVRLDASLGGGPR